MNVKLEKYFTQDAIEAISKEIEMINAVRLSLENRGHEIPFEEFKKAAQKAVDELDNILQAIKDIHKQEQ
jgi:archaellum component FlaC